MDKRFYFDPLYGEKQYEDDNVMNYFYSLVTDNKELAFAKGRTEFSPNCDLIAGNCYNINIKYIDEDMHLMENSTIIFSIPRTWTQPQNDNKKEYGFIHAIDEDDNELPIRLTHNGNLQWWVSVTNIKDKNKVVKLIYDNVTIQRFPQSEFNNWRNALRVILDYRNDKDYCVVKAENTQKPTIMSAPPARLYAAAPTVVKSGQNIKLRFSTLDYCDNRAYPYYDKEVFAFSNGEPSNPVGMTKATKEDKGYGEIDVKVPSEGESTSFNLINRNFNLFGRTQEIIIDDNEDMQVYFGDIHAKTNLTDGLKTPNEYFEHAREVALLDFAAIADHNCEESSYVEGPFTKQMTDEAFELIKKACEDNNHAGKFATIQAFEQNELDGYAGHRNVYFRGLAPKLFRGKTLEDLYGYLEGHKAMVIPHHHIIWNTRVHLDNTEYSRVIEMYSMHCTSEDYNTPFNNCVNDLGKTESGESAIDILNAGYKVGFISSSDNHNGAPGLSARPSRFTNLVYPGGLAAVYSDKLTREDIFDNMYSRNCYATSGARIYLNYKVNDHRMGSTLSCNGEKLEYSIKIGATAPIGYVELVNNLGKKKIYTHNSDKRYLKLEGVIDNSDIKWQYVKVIQVDNHMAWSSPIWIEK